MEGLKKNHSQLLKQKPSQYFSRMGSPSLPCHGWKYEECHDANQQELKTAADIGLSVIELQSAKRCKGTPSSRSKGESSLNATWFPRFSDLLGKTGKKTSNNNQICETFLIWNSLGYTLFTVACSYRTMDN